mmetsp:Transcript_1062/g.2289  ORF Transcript_1062/g.2289 Transcript_1062/m.2289 type:complete len:151 (-) Transcript_1062:381-833(-)
MVRRDEGAILPVQQQRRGACPTPLVLLLPLHLSIWGPAAEQTKTKEGDVLFRRRGREGRLQQLLQLPENETVNDMRGASSSTSKESLAMEGPKGLAPEVLLGLEVAGAPTNQLSWMNKQLLQFPSVTSPLYSCHHCLLDISGLPQLLPYQ